MKKKEIPIEMKVIAEGGSTVKNVTQVVNKVTKIIGNPFVSIYDRILGPAEGPRLKFEIEPTRNEFETGKVLLPDDVINKIDTMLNTQREALVIGKAASGKTTLAYGYGLRHKKFGGTTYYLDCKDHAGHINVGVMRDVIKNIYHPELLVIIDNIHIIPDDFELLRRTLRNLQVSDNDEPTTNSFKVLYLSREIHQYASDKLKTVERMEAVGRVIVLQPNKDFFMAVYNRFAIRYNVSLPIISDIQIGQWVDMFAGDLIAFAVTINSLNKKLADPNVDINPEVALENIRRRYLEPLSSNQTAFWNLLLLCAMSELELVANSEMFEYKTPIASPFEELIKEGIVHEKKIGINSRYDLFHPSLGSLILKAAPGRQNWISALSGGCFRRPSATVHILRRMYARGLFEEAKEFETILRNPEFFDHCVKHFKINEWHKLFSVLNNSSPDMFLFVEGMLHEEKYINKFIQELTKSPLQFISSFIRYFDKKSPSLNKSLKKKLLNKGHQDALLSTALDRPLCDLSLFFNYAKEGMPEVANALSQNLSQEKYRELLVQKLTDAELHYISQFLEYAERNIPDVNQYLVSFLSKKENKLILFEKAVSTQPHLLIKFLEYADGSPLQEAGLYIRENLFNKIENQKKLLIQLVSIGVGHLKIVLKYVKKNMPEIVMAIQEKLMSEEYFYKLINRILETPLHEIAIFLQYVKRDWRKLIIALDNTFSSKEYSFSMLDLALSQDLHLVGAFLEKTKDITPKTFQFLINNLSGAENNVKLLMLAANTPLGNLKNFFRSFEKIAPEICKAIRKGFGDERNNQYLIRLQYRSLEAPLDHLAAFLSYADNMMPFVSNSIKKWLLQEENKNKLVARAVYTPSTNMRGFLNYADWNMPELVEAIRFSRHNK